MIALFKLITGEFVIGKKNDKDKIIEKPYLIVPTPKGVAMVVYSQGMAKQNHGIPYSCILVEYEPKPSIADNYSQVISPLTIPKKKIINLAMNKNLN